MWPLGEKKVFRNGQKKKYICMSVMPQYIANSKIQNREKPIYNKQQIQTTQQKQPIRKPQCEANMEYVEEKPQDIKQMQNKQGKPRCKAYIKYRLR